MIFLYIEMSLLRSLEILYLSNFCINVFQFYFPVLGATSTKKENTY